MPRLFSISLETAHWDRSKLAACHDGSHPPGGQDSTACVDDISQTVTLLVEAGSGSFPNAGWLPGDLNLILMNKQAVRSAVSRSCRFI